MHFAFRQTLKTKYQSDFGRFQYEALVRVCKFCTLCKAQRQGLKYKIVYLLCLRLKLAPSKQERSSHTRASKTQECFLLSKELNELD